MLGIPFPTNSGLSKQMDILKDLVKYLNKKGFSGGIYYYKKGECSCCYGLKNKFFEINGNIPENWGRQDDLNYHKITYKTDNTKKAETFRKLANEYLENKDVMLKKAKDISECIQFTI